MEAFNENKILIDELLLAVQKAAEAHQQLINIRFDLEKMSGDSKKIDAARVVLNNLSRFCSLLSSDCSNTQALVVNLIGKAEDQHHDLTEEEFNDLMFGYQSNDK